MKYNPDIIKSNRKTIQLELRADGKLVVRAPKRMSYRDIEAYVNSNEQWIDRALSKHRSLYGDPLPPYTEKELEEFTALAKAVIPTERDPDAPAGSDLRRHFGRDPV